MSVDNPLRTEAGIVAKHKLISLLLIVTIVGAACTGDSEEPPDAGSGPRTQSTPAQGPAERWAFVMGEMCASLAARPIALPSSQRTLLKQGHLEKFARSAARTALSRRDIVVPPWVKRSARARKLFAVSCLEGLRRGVKCRARFGRFSELSEARLQEFRDCLEQ
jgi:hypothetical protein